MRVVKIIRLNDGSEHSTKQSAERHLLNILSSGSDLKMFETLAVNSAFKNREYFIENYNQVYKTMQVIHELKEVQELKEFN